MRGVLSAACLALGVAGTIVGSGAARAETGGFFKNMFGGGERQGAIEDAPMASGPKLYDPDAVFCPNVGVRGSATAQQAYAGAAGDGSRLRHQLTFARLSRACTPRADGGQSIKVGVEVRALLGPAGAPGSFEAPLTITIRTNDKVLDTRTRRIRVTVPAGSAQGSATVIEDGLVVPAAQSGNYDIEVAMAGAAAKPKPARVAGRPGGKPARTEAAADGGAAANGQ